MPAFKPLKRLSGTRKTHDRCIQTICQECSAGCGLQAWVQDETIVDVGGDESHPVSRGRLCARGLAFMQALRLPDRITLPGFRQRPQGPFEAFDNWEKGLDFLAARLKSIQSQHPPEALLIACDPMAGLDFLMGARRFAQLWGTPHVYHPLDDPELPPERLPLTSPTLACTDWPRAGCLLLVEADLAVTHPVVFQWVQEARRQGAQIVVCDSRFTVTASQADRFIPIRPDSGNLLGAALTHALLAADLVTSEALEARFSDAAAWRATYTAASGADLEAAAGITNESLIALSRMLHQNGPITVITGKRLAFQAHYPIWLTLVSAMDWLMQPGGGWYPLESGAADLQAAGDIPPQATTSAFAPAMRYPYQTRRAHSISDPPPIRAMIGSGNCLNDFLSPFAPYVRDMDLVAYFGAFPNQTRNQSHVVFPATLWPEREGICFSNDRRVQWASRIVAPSDACRTGLGFWMRLAQRLGWEDAFGWRKASGLADQAAFYDWLLATQPATRGMTTALLQGATGGLIWPYSHDLKHSAPPCCTFPTPNGAMQPAPAPLHLPELKIDPLYPLMYQATRIAARHSDASHWQPWTRELADELAVQIHPDLAQALDIHNGAPIVVTAGTDRFEGRAHISRMVRRDMVWSKQRLSHARVMVHSPSQDIDTARTIISGKLRP